MLACPFAKPEGLLNLVFDFCLQKTSSDHHGGEDAKYGECIEWDIGTASTEEAGQ
jgi:hypothetical protein